MTRPTTTLVTVFAVVLSLAGCGGDDGGSDTDTSASSQPASALNGTYERTVTKADLERTIEDRKDDPGYEPSPTGVYSLEIRDGQFTTADPENFSISQQLTASDAGNFDIGDYIRPDKGSFCGPSVPQGAIYEWTLESGVLTLKAESDSCADRDAILTGDWKRK